MKRILILVALCLTSVIAHSQCTTCNSFAEALKEPGRVIAIKINSMQHDITLKEIPADIAKFTNLKTLWLSSHEIKEINKNVCKLENLRSLSLAENHLKNIPDCIYEMKNLKEIILINNELSEETKKAIKTRFKKANPDIKVDLDM